MEVKKNFKLILFVTIYLFTSLAPAKTLDFIDKPIDSIEPYCSGNIDFQNQLILEKIEIRVNKNKKWSKNLLNLHVYLEDEKSKSEHKNWIPEFRIDKKYKKKFKSKILVKYKGFEECIFNSRIRVTGDMWWHLNWNKGNPTSSLHIELLNGHINNITRFKLFLPKSRYGGNELFTAIFLKKLGFLSPRTFFTKAKVNGFTGEYIFQEDLRKEFLEHYLLREGPILEGDERFTISLKDSEQTTRKQMNLSKLANKAYAKKSIANSRIALDSVSNLNLLYLHNHKAKVPELFQKSAMYLFTQDLFADEKNSKLFEVYESLIYALDASHSLSLDDRRFYYNSLDQTFLPIYYDGKSKILELNQTTSNKDLASTVSAEAKRGAVTAIEKIAQINKKSLLNELNSAGINLRLSSLNEIIKKIVKRLNIIKNSNPVLIKTSSQSKYFSLFNLTESRSKKLVFTDIQLKEFYICDFKIKNCETLSMNKTNYKKSLASALSQDFSFLKESKNLNFNFIFVHSDREYENLSFISSNNLFDWHSLLIENTMLQFNNYIELKIDHEKKSILIKQKNKNGLVLFKNGKLDNWNIFFQGSDVSPLDKSINYNSNNLTGCLNLYNVRLENVSFSLKNTMCEDSINLINSKGYINSIDVINSASDAVDIDFSNLNIKKITVNNSLNDCLDLSYGNYVIEDIHVVNCGDKGVSVGEKSNLKIETLRASKTHIALASKDSSLVTLNSSEITNSSICFAAYRKKQEFSSGKIIINESNCKKKNFFQTKDSSIIF